MPGADRVTLRWCATASTVSTIGLCCTIAWFLLLAAVIDRGFIRDDGPGAGGLSSVMPLLIVMVTLLMVRIVTTWLAERCSALASSRWRSALRHRLTTHLVHVGPAGVQRDSTGEVASTLGAGVEALDDYTTKFLPAAVMAVIGPVLIFGVIAVLDPWTTPILLFTGPMLVLLLAVIGRGTAELTRRRFDELGWLSAFYLDMVGGLGTLKGFGRAKEGARSIESVSRRFNDTTMEVLRTAFQTSLVMEWAATAATALAAVAISFRMIEAGMPFGTGLAVLVLVPEFFVPFRRLALEYHAGQSGDAALERIDALLALPAMTADRPGEAVAGGADASTDLVPICSHHAPIGTRTGHPDELVPNNAPDAPIGTRTGNPDELEPNNAPDAPIGTRTPPSVALDDVTFTYPDAAAPALDRLNLRVDSGETVALVGPSGAGKTTIVRLLMGFVAPDSGRILIDGAPLGPTDISEWRRNVAWVPQDPTLIAGTVAENIALGEPDAPIDLIRAAASVARAETFIDSLPDGFDTVVGERGLRLSGGQRQRLAIARAALRDAPVVVLDEFTAHLDEHTEAELLAAIADLLTDRTAVVVAHRQATIDLADRIITIEPATAAAGPPASGGAATGPDAAGPTAAGSGEPIGGVSR